MKVSALVVTNRPQFLAWWMHQIKKQTRQPDEVIVVDNRPDLTVPWIAGGCQGPLGNSDPNGPFYYAKHLDPKTPLGELRQAALEAATGDVVLWFDDDDWYHPRRIEMSVAPIESGRYDACVFPLTHWYYLKEQLLYPNPTSVGPFLPATAWRAEIAKRVRFEPRALGEDHFWIHALLHPLDGSAPLIAPARVHYVSDYYSAVGAIIVVHSKNCWQISLEQRGLSPTARRECQSLPRFAPKDVAQEEWDETKRMLWDLRHDLQLDEAPIRR